jgi:hypothetical protein
MKISRNKRLRNRFTDEDCTVVAGPDGAGRWAVVYDDRPYRYWVRPSALEPRA